MLSILFLKAYADLVVENDLHIIIQEDSHVSESR